MITTTPGVLYIRAIKDPPSTKYQIYFEIQTVALLALKLFYETAKLYKEPKCLYAGSFTESLPAGLGAMLTALCVMSLSICLLLRRPPGFEVIMPKVPQFENTLEGALKACSQRGLNIVYLKEKWRDHKQVALVACFQDASCYGYFAYHLRQDLDVVLACIGSQTKDKALLGYLPKRFLDQKELVNMALQKGASLQYAPSNLIDDERLVFTACQRDGLELKFASSRLQSCYKIVNIACQQNPRAIQYAGCDFRSLWQVIDDYNRVLNKQKTVSEDDLKKELALRLVLQNF